MTKNKKKTPSAELPVTSFGVFVAGICLIVICVISSFLLVLDHWGGLSLPGCGPRGGCAQAAASVWGKVPGFNWPTSFVGFAYFVGLLVLWSCSRRGFPPVAIWVARLGVLASLGFILIMVVGNYLCPYCIAAHAANIAFLLVADLLGKTAPSGKPVLPIWGIVCLVVSLVLWPVDLWQQRVVAERGEQKFAESLEQITEEPAAQETGTEDGEPFIGRYPIGPEEAPIRIVMITDYQCEDCQIFEKQLKRIINERTDVQVSIKYFPFSDLCNEYARGKNPHPNACWAAKAAEAAGQLGGTEGFWQMHEWLFAQNGSFTNQSLPEDLRNMGYDPRQFTQMMMSEEVGDLIQQDIEEAHGLGLHYTPMIFINGKQLYWHGVPSALVRAVESIAATNPPARAAKADRPVRAAEKYIQDWREQRTWNIAPATRPWAQENPLVAASVIIWGDYQEKSTIKLDRRIRAALADVNNVRYVFRQFPFNEQCNYVINHSPYEYSCLAASAVEAAGILGGEEAQRNMHAALMELDGELDEAIIRNAAMQLGFDVDALWDAMNDPACDAGIQEDLRSAQGVGIKGIPMLLIDGKRVPRWKLEGAQIVEKIIQEAMDN